MRPARLVSLCATAVTAALIFLLSDSLLAPLFYIFSFLPLTFAATAVFDPLLTLSGTITAHSAPVALREGILYVRVLQPALHYELEQVSKIDILRKLKQRFGGKVMRDVRFRVG